jgi:hypothetical protein
MSGAIPPLPQYVFMAWCSVTKKSIGTTLPLPFTLIDTRFIEIRRRIKSKNDCCQSVRNFALPGECVTVPEVGLRNSLPLAADHSPFSVMTFSVKYLLQ